MELINEFDNEAAGYKIKIGNKMAFTYFSKKMLFLKLLRIPIKTVKQAVTNIQKDVQDLDVKIIT